MLSDDENDQTVTPQAFALLHHLLAQRLTLGRLTVVDATNVQAEARKPLVDLARKHHVLPVAIVLDLPEALCRERNAARPDRAFGSHVIRNHRTQLRRSLKGLSREGFRQVVHLTSPEEVAAIEITRVPLWTNRRHESGPFDVIGDIHGCADELERLLGLLGYERDPANRWLYRHPQGRRAIFLGDLVDRGPRILDTCRIVMAMTTAGAALCVPGNHDAKLLRKLRGRDVQITHGLAETLAEIDALPPTERETLVPALIGFLDGLVSHYVLDDGKLVVAHAGLKAEMHGRASGRVRDFALYGETTGEIDSFGLPVRHNWAAEYRGKALVAFGHTPVPESVWLNETVNLDTGCVFGGHLSALRYPEREVVRVAADRVYCEPTRPLAALASMGAATPGLSAQHEHDSVLDAADVSGKRIVHTRLRGNVTVRAEHASAALEVMSRFAADPRWLIYLPPTMSPCDTSQEPGLLEHPAEAFAYYRNQGVPRVVCEEKHMGSRAVLVLCRDADTARERFGIPTGETGIVLTRTGRRFFTDAVTETAFVDRLRQACSGAGLWETLQSDWVCLDAELMPWSAKAQELLRQQYAAVGAAGRAMLPHATEQVRLVQARLSGADAARAAEVLEKSRRREGNIAAFVEAYRPYCWPVRQLSDWKLAPFHVLASEGGVHHDRPHVWHLETIARLHAVEPELLRPTRWREVDVTDPAGVAAATAWWHDLTQSGGEGMVVKPGEFLWRGPRGLAQPAVKCRGREYLRLIYGPDYTDEANLSRLRQRHLGTKRNLALSELALGIEALERFVRREPLRRVHECVFAVLALESEPVDPRL
jgi:protein phosphatase